MINCIIIDDDKDIVTLFCDMLSMIGVDILATGNDGNEAVGMYKKHHPDLVFTDLNMPKYDGFYAITKIKEMNPDAKIIVITGDSTATKNDFLSSFDVKIVIKPFKIEEIKQIIEEAHLTFNVEPKSIRIQYKFKDDNNLYSCVTTYEQYMNFRLIPIVQECKIVKNEQKTLVNQNEIQKAIKLALENDTSHIRKLSEIV
jgi:CheY-like chemotaxis protein